MLRLSDLPIGALKILVITNSIIIALINSFDSFIINGFNKLRMS